MVLATFAFGMGCGGGSRGGGAANAGSNAGGQTGSAGTGTDGGVVPIAGSGGASNGGTAGNLGTGGNLPAAGNAGTSGAAGSTGAPPGIGEGGNPTDGELGARCTQDTDCREELTCIPTSGDIFELGGPAGGWCTMPCQYNLVDTDCQTVSTLGTCVPFNDNGTPDNLDDDTGYCTELCLADTAPVIENKCHQRAEMTCLPFPAQSIGWCLPLCQSDADCGDRFCDLNLGTCVDTAPAGDPIGTGGCTTDEDCTGYCLGLIEGDPASNFCSGACNVGGRGCGEDPTSTDPASFICIPLLPESLGVGDLGSCFEACDCNEQCTSAANICIPHENPTLQTIYARVGFCGPPVPMTPMGDAGMTAADAGPSDAGVIDDPFVTGIVACP